VEYRICYAVDICCLNNAIFAEYVKCHGGGTKEIVADESTGWLPQDPRTLIPSGPFSTGSYMSQDSEKKSFIWSMISPLLPQRTDLMSKVNTVGGGMIGGAIGSGIGSMMNVMTDDTGMSAAESNARKWRRFMIGGIVGTGIGAILGAYR
jgi:hypothetical protein